MMDDTKRIKIESKCQMSPYTLEYAMNMDEEDALSQFRNEFNIPLAKDVIKKYATDNKETGIQELLKGIDDKKECLYLVGNSLGLQPKKAGDRVDELMKSWGTLCGYSLRDYIPGDEPLRLPMERVVGAKSGEVALMNTLTVNLSLGLTTFYHPKGLRNKIFIEDFCFSSDYYTFESYIKLHGLDPKTSLLVQKAREGEWTLRTEDILDRIEQEGDSIELILFSGVQYYTGQLFEMEKITRAGHAKGCKVGFNLAHAAGNIPLSLHDWEVDFACWCSYKYLNGGPGGIGGFFIHERYAERFDLPRIAGWWAHEPETRFLMDNKLILQKGAPGFALSNPGMLLLSCMEASLDIFSRAGMTEIRKKSLLLTGYLEYLIEGFNDDPRLKGLIEVITPRDEDQRGAQLSLLSIHAKEIYPKLKLRGIAVDYRHPDVIRVAPIALYTRFREVLEFYQVLREILIAEE